MEPIDVAMIGSGEYTTGYTNSTIKSDKKLGVVGLVLFDLRRRGGFVNHLSIVGTNSEKWKGVEEHFKNNIEAVYKDMDCSFEPFPKPGEPRNVDAYKLAINKLKKGSAITIFTPDNTHFEIALFAIQRGLHVLITKPAVQTLEDHLILIEEAEKAGVYVCIEMHKRFDPAYADGKQKSKSLGGFNFFSSYMSQPKSQLSTFSAWAGKESDISYYLNSHHIDIHCWYLNSLKEKDYIPIKVTASGSTGIAMNEPFNCQSGTEDTISLLVDWISSVDPSDKGTAVYTASWTAPLGAGVHSEQSFHYMGSTGEIRIDQARRAYTLNSDQNGTSHINPFYMQYSPDCFGYFNGQNGYGYLSIEKFIQVCQKVNQGKILLKDLDEGLPTIKNTVVTTAILEAGRRSSSEGKSISISRKDGVWSLE